jgi:hypothetical protein
MSLTLCNYSASSPSTPNCVTCGSAIDFVSNPAGDGVYADDNSELLLLRSGGSFNNIYTVAYDESMPGIVSTAIVFRRNSATTSDGDTYISYNDDTVATASIIYHYDNTGILVNTITLPHPGATTVRSGSMTYSEFDGKIYFISHPFGGFGNPLSVYQLDPSNDSYVRLTGLSAGITSFPGVFANPLNGHLMFPDNFGNTRIGNPATDTMINTGLNPIPESGFPIVNTNNGHIWIVTGANTINIWDVSGVAPVNVGTATGPVGYLSKSSSSNGPVRGATYYPGDGTVGSDRMFVMYDDPGVGTYTIEFDANAPYTATTFVTLPLMVSPVNILYSYVYNKLILTYDNNLDAYDPNDGTTPYASITLGLANNVLWPYEDTANKQIVYYNMANSPANNLFWVGLDTTNALFCSEGLVDMFISNDGPYFWDEATTSWISVVSSIVLSDNLPASNLFTVTATLGAYGLTACLLISTDGGVSFSPLIDTSNELYADDTVWGAGRVYNRPIGAYSIKLQINTLNDCRVLSDEITA